MAKAAPIWDEFLAWADQVYTAGVAYQRTRQALAYLLGYAQGLRRYCDDGRLPISNIRKRWMRDRSCVVAAGLLRTGLGRQSDGRVSRKPPVDFVGREVPLPWNLTPEQVAERYAWLPTP